MARQEAWAEAAAAAAAAACLRSRRSFLCGVRLYSASESGSVTVAGGRGAVRAAAAAEPLNLAQPRALDAAASAEASRGLGLVWVPRGAARSVRRLLLINICP